MTQVAVFWRSNSIFEVLWIEVSDQQVCLACIFKQVSFDYLPRQSWDVLWTQWLSLLSVAEGILHYQLSLIWAVIEGQKTLSVAKLRLLLSPMWAPWTSSSTIRSDLNSNPSSTLSSFSSKTPVLSSKLNNLCYLRRPPFQDILHLNPWGLVSAWSLLKSLQRAAFKSELLDKIDSNYIFWFTDWLGITEKCSAKTVWDDFCFPGTNRTSRSYLVSFNSILCSLGGASFRDFRKMDSKGCDLSLQLLCARIRKCEISVHPRRLQAALSQCLHIFSRR